MKNAITPFLVAAFLLAFASSTHARVLTLTVVNHGPASNGVAEVTIESYEVAEVLSLREDDLGQQGSKIRLTVLKDGRGASLKGDLGAESVKPIVVAGPARIVLATEGPQASGFCTLRITPEAYPPDKSILVPPGAGGATVTLECSTDLVNWTAATNGVYTNLLVAKFFRIQADRIP